jgi:HAD superfamily hydrolase (TIGR01457 family)
MLGFILDLDGTVYRGDTVIPGAPETIAWLRDQGHRVLFLTNMPLKRRGDYARKLTDLGIPTRPDDVLFSSVVLADYLSLEFGGATVFVIGEEPLTEELAAAGMRISEDPEEIEIVVASFDRGFTYQKLDIGFQALRRGARFFATNGDATLPVEGGEVPDAAATIAALEACSGRTVDLVVGKPSTVVVDMALRRLDLPADSCFVVGDRLETDILMGLRAGMTTALVLTGVTDIAEVDVSPIRPHYVLDSIGELRGHVPARRIHESGAVRDKS